MSSSTLDPDNTLIPDRQLGKGHGVNALGPSDTSDTGSDAQGGYRAVEDDDLALDRGSNEDPTSHIIRASHYSEDSGATGEDTTAGRNEDIEFGKDIGFDRIDTIEGINNDIDSDDADELRQLSDSFASENKNSILNNKPLPRA